MTATVRYDTFLYMKPSRRPQAQKQTREKVRQVQELRRSGAAMPFHSPVDYKRTPKHRNRAFAESE